MTISITIIVLTVTSSGSAVSDDRPMVRAEAAVVELDRQPTGRRLLRLPNLDFPLQIEPRCGFGLRIESLSISIADTNKSFAAKDFLEQSTLETSFRLPGRQIGPLAIEQFCTADDESPSNSSTLIIRDALTAHISLRCADDVRQTVVYETLALEIRMVCKNPEREESTAIADQVSSATSTRLLPRNSRVRIQASSAADGL